MANGTDVEHHDAQGMGDYVVQLTRDPGAFLGDRDPRGRLALAFGLLGAVLGRLGLEALLPLREPSEPGKRKDDG
jgi:hypothetical protein